VRGELAPVGRDDPLEGMLVAGPGAVEELLGQGPLAPLR